MRSGFSIEIFKHLFFFTLFDTIINAARGPRGYIHFDSSF